MRKEDGVWRGGWAHGNIRDRANEGIWIWTDIL
jgi:hypothetical protein